MMLLIHYEILFIMHERLALDIMSKVRGSLQYCLFHADLLCLCQICQETEPEHYI